MPKAMNTAAANHLICFSGIFLCSTIPRMIPAVSATSIPPVVLSHTGITVWNSAASAIVASCVLSPISAIKKAILTYPIAEARGF